MTEASISTVQKPAVQTSPVRWRFFSLLFGIFYWLDLVMTCFALSVLEAGEANPLAAWIWAKYGVMGLFLLKLLLWAALSIILRNAVEKIRKLCILFGAIFYTIVFINNSIVILLSVIG